MLHKLTGETDTDYTSTHTHANITWTVRIIECLFEEQLLCFAKINREGWFPDSQLKNIVCMKLSDSQVIFFSL